MANISFKNGQCELQAVCLEIIYKLCSQELRPCILDNRLVSIAEVRRRTAKSASILITIRGHLKGASSTIIAGWNKTLLTDSGIL